MKKTIAMMMTGLMVLSLSACGSGATSKEANATETSTEVAAEATTEQTVGLANPWREATEEAFLVIKEILANYHKIDKWKDNLKKYHYDNEKIIKQIEKLLTINNK